VFVAFSDADFVRFAHGHTGTGTGRAAFDRFLTLR
jgi:hypothetical protein